MIFHGFLKLTLLDFPEKTACTVFTAGCNYRCPFCHNAPLVTSVPEERYSEDEILDYLKKRRGILDGICVTGGEPLLHSDIASFLRRVKEAGIAVKLDTNGSFPDRLKALIDEGLVDYVAMDIKNSWGNYPLTVGVPDYDTAAVRESAALLMRGNVPYEFRTTVVAEFHTIEDIVTIAQDLKGASRYYLQNFEDSGELIGNDLHAVSRETLENMRLAAQKYIPNVTLRGV